MARGKQRPTQPLAPLGPDLQSTRRWLPHWQLGGATYFVTFRTRGVDLGPDIRRLVLAALRHFDDRRYVLWTAVVMPDHVHMLLTPMPIRAGSWWSLPSILHSLKSFTAKQANAKLNRVGALWMQESFDRIVRDEAEMEEKWRYIRNNPVERGLCARPENWDAFYERTGGWPAGGTG
jgi:REP element-mobilizing transposase RayT